MNVKYSKFIGIWYGPTDASIQKKCNDTKGQNWKYYRIIQLFKLIYWQKSTKIEDILINVFVKALFIFSKVLGFCSIIILKIKIKHVPRDEDAKLKKIKQWIMIMNVWVTEEDPVEDLCKSSFSRRCKDLSNRSKTCKQEQTVIHMV